MQTISTWHDLPEQIKGNKQQNQQTLSYRTDEIDRRGEGRRERDNRTDE